MDDTVSIEMGGARVVLRQPTVADIQDFESWAWKAYAMHELYKSLVVLENNVPLVAIEKLDFEARALALLFHVTLPRLENDAKKRSNWWRRQRIAY